MRSSLTLVLSAVAILSACDKEKAEPSTAATPSATAVATTTTAAGPTPPPAAPAPTATAAGTASTAENIPVAADFEDEAEKSITKANYRAELDSLEAEIK